MKPFLIFIGSAALFLVGGSWWSNNAQQKAYEQEIQGIDYTVVTNRSHVKTEVDYKDTPPVGGNHYSVWLGCNGNIYDEPVVDENAVHSLEHGAVWITYRPTLAAEEIEALKGKVKGYSFISPYPEQESPIVLTAWGVQLSLDSADDPRIDQFLAKFRQGPQTPEPGATCNTIPGGMQ
tara:strand:+ start:3829 stop:4362 length:534 start_codon:yes stop_codon:yes gene_type:complete